MGGRAKSDYEEEIVGGGRARWSVLLGRSGTRITERHYSPWVRSRQEQLETFSERAWARGPVALAAAQDVPEKQGRRHVN